MTEEGPKNILNSGTAHAMSCLGIFSKIPILTNAAKKKEGSRNRVFVFETTVVGDDDIKFEYSTHKFKYPMQVV